MTTEVSICNLALSHVGAPLISALTQQTREAQLCNVYYAHTRDVVLASQDWSFARKQKTLALLSDTFDGWDYAYTYPSDCLIPRKILNVTDPDVVIEYDLIQAEGGASRIILTDEATAILVYTAKITNVNMFEPGFVDAHAFLLASHLAIPLRGDKVLAKELLNKYIAFGGNARVINSNVGTLDPITTNIYTDAR